MNLRFGLAAAGVTLACGAFAASVLVGDYDHTTLEVGANETLEQTGPVVTTPLANFDKSGEGTWKLPLGTIRSKESFSVNVRGGTVEIPTEAGAVPSFEAEPAVIRAKADIWLDAHVNVLTDGSGVQGWLDVRETKTEKPFDYPRVRTRNNYTTDCPQLSTVDNDQPAIYFGGYKSGQWMAFLATDSSDTANATLMKDFRHVFVVHRIDTTQGYLLGCQSNVSPKGGIVFHPGDSSASLSMTILGDAAAAHQYRFERNGVSVNPSTSTPVTGLQLYDWHFVGGADNFAAYGGRAHFSALFNGMYDNRQGGDRICELIAFRCWLSEAERLAVAGYLMDKWGVASAVGAKTVHVAAGSTLKAPVSAVRVTGEGTFVPNAADGEDGFFPEDALGNFCGTVSLPANRRFVTLENVDLELSGGDRLVATNVFDGLELTRHRDADAKTIVKEGSAVTTVHALPEDLETLQVSGGTLRLAANVRFPSMVGGTATNAPVTNGSFETGGDGYLASCFSEGGASDGSATRGGWTGHLRERPAGGYPNAWCKMFNSSSGNAAQFNVGTDLTPEGAYSFGMRGPAYVERSFTVDVDGVYDLNFLYLDCSGAASSHLLFGVWLGDEDGANMTQLASVLANGGTGMFRYHYQTPYLKAGAYKLRVGVDPLGPFAGIYAAVDDIRFDLITRPSSGWAVPNGDMEKVEKTTDRLTMSNSAVAEGWTFNQVPWGTNQTIPGAAIIRHGAFITPNTAASGDNSVPVGEIADQHHGNMQLVLVGQPGGGNVSTATVTFKPVKAGVYRLKADFGRAAYSSVNGVNTWSSPILNAKIKIGDADAIDLDRIYSNSRRLRPFVFGTDVVFANTNETVVLTLRNVQQTSIGIVDNLEFIPAAECREGTTLADDGKVANILKSTFYAANWTFVKRDEPAPSVMQSSYAGQVTNFGGLYYGWSYYRGITYGIRLTDLGGAYQQVVFPCPGRYRLRFHARARADVRDETYTRNFAYGKASCIRAVLADGDVTNTLYETSTATTNFVGHTCYFDVKDASKTYVFGFEGANDPHVTGIRDQNTYICHPFIEQIDSGDVPTEFSLPPTLKTIKVAAGAKLGLDYAGTNDVDTVKFAGRRMHGVLTAENCPEFITGPGALNAFGQGPGGMILVR